ncbi:MAG: glycosyltransferase family 39 protein [Victivallaceae bacterium]|nr:glycosyltransferase family 39 protein [Victivallaceae bacterium]
MTFYRMRNFFETASAAKKLFCFVSLLLLVRLFSNCFLPVFDPSEARYANICANMAASGNFLEPKFIHDGEMQIFEGKPPLYFQMGALSCKLFGRNEFAVRFPAMLSAIIILLLVFFTVKKFKGEISAVQTTLIVALSPVFLAFSGFCMTDLLLAAAICGAVCFYLLFLSEADRKRKKLFSCGFFAAMGVGMIVKGPVALVLAGMPIFFFTAINCRWRDLKDHAWFAGILLFLLISAPWFWLMQAKNPDFLEYFFINENFKRFLFKDYGDRYGAGRESFRGMALLFMLLCNLPGLLLLAFPFKNRKNFKFAALRNYLREPLAGMALLWVICGTLFWCLTSRVLITYLLPTIPAAAIVIADLLEKSGRLQDPVFCRKMKKTVVIWGALLMLVTVASIGCLPTLRDNGGHFFRDLARSEKYAGSSFYFLRKTPYSAEFYMGSRVRHHANESQKISAANSRECILLVNQKELKKYGIPAGRKLLDRRGFWSAWSPEISTPRN